ncbi:hypothetical protein NP493_906g00047 [Ridgeia piscesae]|uniref:Beta-1,4-N-acetylgalactosaminyltransferase bre-4 n=1 Tax=Ridgeia piscesae TaxID=27915 RepID=A0AAD9NJX7_RIDPI|nr:hypothetical protein NP493_906g00047 [Ridgeia piscesae]
MSVALCKRCLRRAPRRVLIILFFCVLSLLLSWTREPAFGVDKDTVPLLETSHNRSSRSMYYAKLSINDTEIERKVSLFLQSYDENCRNKTTNLAHSNSDILCSCVPPGLGGSFVPDTTVWPWATLADRHRELAVGGRWRPGACTARQRIAIVIPFRDRDEHLRILLQNLHPVLQRQQLEYQVFVVEQAFPHIFNKAALMNIGFHEAKKSIPFDCIVFHDVDMLPADDRQPYTCFQSPVHLGAYVDKYKYGGLYVPMFGGVAAFTKQQFEDVNGFSNSFFGWGGEDDDMRLRIASARLNIYRHPVEVSRYRMLQHRRDHRNPTNPFRGVAYRYRPTVYARNGVNSIKYKTHAYEEKPLYTWLLVEPVSSVSNYTLHTGTCKEATMATLRVPIHKCAEACDAHARCTAFVFDNGIWCFLKRWPCPDPLPSPSQRLYVSKTNKGRQDTNVLSKYRRRLGDCVGGDIGANVGVNTATACAHRCDDDVRCVGFVFAATLSTKCYLKMASCAVMAPKDGATMYDSINQTQSHFDVLSGYRRRPGDCGGGDIGSVPGVETETACARICDHFVGCDGFVFVPSQITKCYLKKASCAKTRPREGTKMYDRISRSRQHTDVLSKYRRRLGDCIGGDIGSVSDVNNAESCAHICENVAECVGFMFVTSSATKCYLKMASCAVPLPRDDAMMYDNINTVDNDLPRASDTTEDSVSRYRSRPGDCPGDDIKGSEVSDINECAKLCDHTPNCVAFSYIVVQSDYCWLKKASCNMTAPILGVTTFDHL